MDGVLTEADIVAAVAAQRPGQPVTRENLLAALLSEDEADLLIAMRREKVESELAWEPLRDELLRRLHDAES